MSQDKKTWKDIVGYALSNQDRIYELRKKRELKEHYRNIRRFVPIPVIIGCLAAFMMYKMYGGEELLKNFLTWVIGLTIVATIIAYIPKRFKYKETQLSGGVTYSVAPGVFPYTGVTFINSVINFNNLINLQNFGYFSGISFLMNNKIIISIENIFFNQVSVNIIGEIKF